MNISDLLGMTIASIEGGKDGDERVTFHMSDGRSFAMFHEQDCCESVSLNDTDGDLADLVGRPLVMAEEVSSDGVPSPEKDYAPESFTWTFYKLGTDRGSVTFRWYGSSNGYYGEGVTVAEVKS